MTESVTPPVDAPETSAPDTTASTEQTDAGEQNQQPTFSQEQVSEYEAMKKFMDANGGFDAVKKNISAPKNTTEQTQPAQEQQPAEQSVEQPQAPKQVPQGKMSRDAFFVQSYMDRLASDPKYEGIADDIRSGKLMKEMADSPVPVFPTDADGNINDAQIRWYLDMKTASMAAQQTTAAPTTTPTVDYVQIEEVKTYDDASKIILQNASLRQAGMAEHPLTEKAKEFMRNYYKK